MGLGSQFMLISLVALYKQPLVIDNYTDQRIQSRCSPYISTDPLPSDRISSMGFYTVAELCIEDEENLEFPLRVGVWFKYKRSYYSKCPFFPPFFPLKIKDL